MEQLEPLIDRYKLIPLWGRLAALVLIGIGSPFYFNYLDESETVQMEFENAQNAKTAAQSELTSKKNKLVKIPQLEEQLQFTKVQLTEAKRKLPDDFDLDLDLKRITNSAKKSGVRLALFQPGSPTPHGDIYKYEEMPIRIEATGGYHQLASFYDDVVHTEAMVNLKSLTFELSDKVSDRPQGVTSKGADEDPRQVRLGKEIKAGGEYLIYRAAPDGVSAEEKQKALENNEKENQKAEHG